MAIDDLGGGLQEIEKENLDALLQEKINLKRPSPEKIILKRYSSEKNKSIFLFFLQDSLPDH